MWINRGSNNRALFVSYTDHTYKNRGNDIYAGWSEEDGIDCECHTLDTGLRIMHEYFNFQAHYYNWTEDA